MLKVIWPHVVVLFDTNVTLDADHFIDLEGQTLQCSYYPSFDSGFTISFWFRWADSTGLTGETLFYLGVPGTNGFGIRIQVNTSQLAYYDPQNVFTSRFIAVPDRWQFLTFQMRPVAGGVDVYWYEYGILRDGPIRVPFCTSCNQQLSISSFSLGVNYTGSLKLVQVCFCLSPILLLCRLSCGFCGRFGRELGRLLSSQAMHK